jgi:hypothetical protein
MACGYGSCKDMAIAIYNGLNKAENRFHYNEAELKDTLTRIMEMKDRNQSAAEHIFKSLNKMNQEITVVQEMDWNSPEVREKLSYAALLHDVTLNNPELAMKANLDLTVGLSSERYAMFSSTFLISPVIKYLYPFSRRWSIISLRVAFFSLFI